MRFRVNIKLQRIARCAPGRSGRVGCTVSHYHFYLVIIRMYLFFQRASPATWRFIGDEDNLCNNTFARKSILSRNKFGIHLVLRIHAGGDGNAVYLMWLIFKQSLHTAPMCLLFSNFGTHPFDLFRQLGYVFVQLLDRHRIEILFWFLDILRQIVVDIQVITPANVVLLIKVPTCQSAVKAIDLQQRF